MKSLNDGACVPKIAIVDYGMGNIGSVTKVLKRLNVEYKVTAEHSGLKWADRIILPGVGAFKKAMDKLHELRLIDPIKELVMEDKKPILGICLGMQLFAKTSLEHQKTEGLGLINADVFRLPINTDYRLPHIGWNTLNIEKECPLIRSLESGCFMYFVHDYAVECYDWSDVTCTTEYSKRFPSVISQNNIFGVQFHPEKSQKSGSVIMTNFVLSGLV